MRWFIELYGPTNLHYIVTLIEMKNLNKLCSFIAFLGLWRNPLIVNFANLQLCQNNSPSIVKMLSMQFLPNKACTRFYGDFQRKSWVSAGTSLKSTKKYQVVESKLAEICNQKSIKGPSFIIFIKGDTKTNKILIQVLSRLYPYFCF